MHSIISLTASDVARIADAARNEARRLGASVTIAVVDAGGHVWRVERLDGALAGTVRIAEGKARTAALLGRPTKLLEDAAAARPGLIGVTDMLAMQGGVPILVDGQLVGGVGASGAAADDDERIAAAGAAQAGKAG